MEVVTINNLTPEQEAVIRMFLNEGKLQAYDELREHFTAELNKITPEDSQHGAYIEYVIEEIKKRFNELVGEDSQE
jgi:hypothetical protein